MPPASAPPSLVDLGWDDLWAESLARTPDPSLTPGRVSRIDRGAFSVLTADGPTRVGADRAHIVAVGDWVTLAPGTAATGPLRVAAILPRRHTFRRATDAHRTSQQVVAANVDTVLLTDALDSQLSARHLERYLSLVWQSGALPVVVITKADLSSPAEVRQHVEATKAVALGVAVHVVSASTGEGVGGLAPYVGPGSTLALLGLSGAGKSTLVNLLAESDLLATGRVRADGQGRHTTTHRQLVPLPGGGVVIDTPGMRALSVWAAAEGVAQAFEDVTDLARQCEFADCLHRRPSGCAVLAAVASGALSESRLHSWQRLGTETAVGRQDTRLRIEDRKRKKATAKAARAETRRTGSLLAPPSGGGRL